jgi:hypothetical protein
MEDVLDIYARPYDPEYPKICFDERPCQLVKNLLAPLPMKPGHPLREDHEYKRNGICELFMAFEPLAKKRIVNVRSHRTRVDYAHFLKDLADTHYPHAKRITLVQDNLNTHSPGSFYEAFPPQEAYRLSQRFEMHYTPKKGSWLNMAELELAAFAKQCLDRRIPDQDTLRHEVLALEQERNRNGKTVHWSFTQHNARRKLQRHYDAAIKN